MENTATRALTRPERLGLLLLLVVLIAFGVYIEIHSAFLSRRMGDLGTYLQPAWAAATGRDLYDIVDENGWHYNYPPLYAILLIPLADPPHGHDAAGYVPYRVSVAVIYVLNIACLAVVVHLLAGAMERYAADRAFRQQPRFSRRWWALRVCPVLICLPAVAKTCMRGQVNVQVLVLLSAWIACFMAGRRRWAGAFLGLAACIKVIPIYLLVYPIWRRDGRGLTGCVLGLFVGLLAVPLAVFGPQRTLEQYQKYACVFFGPLLGLSDDRSRDNEILGMNATDCMGIKHALHNWRYPDVLNRPPQFDTSEELVHVGLGLLMMLAVLWPLRRRRPAGSWPVVHEIGALLLLMVICSPISHMHYFIFCLPLVMSLLVHEWEGGTTLYVSWPLAPSFAWFVVANTLPSVPGLEWMRDKCLPLLGALPLWTIGVVQLWRVPPIATVASPPKEEPAMAA
jgi:hypothetical protein